MEDAILQNLLFDFNNIFSLNDSSNSFQFLFSFILAIIISYVISFFYKYALDDQNFSDSQLSNSIVIITVTTFVVVYIVKSSITLSLGLVGALSIVRFRTPIKDPLELSALFVAIAIGISLAVFQYSIAIIFSFFTCFYFLYLKSSKINSNSFVNKIPFIGKNKVLTKCNLEIQSNNEFNIEEIIDEIENNNVSHKLLSSSSFDNKYSMNIAIFLNHEDDVKVLSNKLNEKLKSVDFHFSRV